VFIALHLSARKRLALTDVQQNIHRPRCALQRWY